ncbi:choice-of-anchor D domain-containing protein [Oscillatoria sp. FACHB-1407]|uniref:choice-of-anchor D domain-containing protein n=1 Tax=Oscillatoria sp. FACHB-1407 TaxID=2692847 RepID=UPI0016891DDA|nr:choice-of-anchor D domain-containing protein [Oscillatoria sp. FACHB-1407]MBD2462347.1 choice-of-anchor D domain-containing protein [Oscillatoria sp. FACHB-1407]
MTARVPTTLINSLQLAKQGDAEAIAALVNRALQPRNIHVVAVSVEDERLHLVLESAQAPDQETVVPFIRQSINQLGTEAIRAVVLYGKAQDQSTQAWQQEIVLESPATVEGDRIVPHYGGEIERSQAFGAESTSKTTVAELPATWLEPDLENSARVAVGNKLLHQTSHGGVVNLAPGFRRLVVRSRQVLTPAQGSESFPDLLDRQLEREEAIAALLAGSSVAFFGETGSGKTALLRSLAHHTELTGAFRDGIVYQRGRFHSASDLLQSLFDAFFECDTTLPTRPTADELRQAFQSHRALAVLDDVDLPESEVAQLHTLPGLVILSASQERQLWNRVNAMPMLGLPLNDALTLVERGLGRSRTADERPDAEVLCNLVQGHPLRILQLTALVREEGQTLAVLVQRLRLAPSVDALPLKAAVSLPEAERRVLAVLVVLDGISVRMEHLAALTGLPNIQTILATLTRRYLVLNDKARYYLSQPVVAALRPAWNLSQWTQRVITYFYRWLERQAQPDALVPELEVLLQVLRLAMTTQQPNVVLRLAQALDPVLLSTGRWSAWEQAWQWALQAGRSLQDPAAMATALHQLGTRALLLDDPLTAHTYLTEALQLRDSLGDRPGGAATRHNLELVLTLPTEVDPVAVAASPPRLLQRRRFPTQVAIVVGSLGMAIAGMLLLLNPFPRPASFSLSATRLGFGEQTLNTTSTSQTIRLTNTGSRPLDITSITPSGNSKDDFQVTEDCTAAPIAPNDDCTVEITFTPQAEGDRLATVLILDRAGDNPQELLLSGIGTPPTSPFVLSFAPGNVTFEPQVLNTASKSQSIMVTNTGSEPVAIARVTVTGEQATDFVSTTNCVNLTLEPRQTCRIQVSFMPKALANRRASVLITAKGESELLATGELPDQPPPFWNIPLGGTGVAPTAQTTPNAASAPPSAPLAAVPRVSLSLSEMYFGAQGIETRAEKPLVIANTGTASLYIDDLTIAGENPRDFAITENTCLGGPILADDGCIVTVRFSPSAAGDRQADLVIRDSASGSPRRIALSGVGLERSPSTAATPTPSGDSSPTILNFAATDSQIRAGESVRLCYGVANASQVVIEGVGDVAPATEECVTVEPGQTTTYNLTAIGADGQEVTAQTTVQVTPADDPPAQPEPGAPLTTPQLISPGSSNRGAAPDLLSCKNSTPLTWESSGSGRDVLTLQQFSNQYQDWMTVFEESLPSGTDITSWLTQYQSYEWRWMVRSVDGAGRSSEPSPWYYFTCYDFQ